LRWFFLLIFCADCFCSYFVLILLLIFCGDVLQTQKFLSCCL
jgi:hypothetical protein